MVQFILVSGKKVSVMVEVFKSGKTGLIMKDIGIIIKLTEKED